MKKEVEDVKNFRFVLSEGNTVLYERMFDGTNVSPFTRNSVDIRSLVSPIINKLQELLSTKKPNTQYTLTPTKKIDFLKYQSQIIKSYSIDKQHSLLYLPKEKERMDGRKGGVECKFGLYINEHPIIERLFYVYGFNPKIKWSTDLVFECNKIVEEIEDFIIEKDQKNIWDDYILITRGGMSIIDVRELPQESRKRKVGYLS